MATQVALPLRLQRSATLDHSMSAGPASPDEVVAALLRSPSASVRRCESFADFDSYQHEHMQRPQMHAPRPLKLGALPAAQDTSRTLWRLQFDRYMPDDVNAAYDELREIVTSAPPSRPISRAPSPTSERPASSGASSPGITIGRHAPSDRPHSNVNKVPEPPSLWTGARDIPTRPDSVPVDMFSFGTPPSRAPNPLAFSSPFTRLTFDDSEHGFRSASAAAMAHEGSDDLVY